MKRLKSVLATSFFVLVIAFFATLVLSNAGVLSFRAYIVETGSMSPTIKPHTAVVVDEGNYHSGDVIAFNEQGKVITHRMVASRSNGAIITKGDANRTIDPWRIRSSAVIGKVVTQSHAIGSAVIYARSPKGILSIVIVLAILGLLYWLLMPRKSSGKNPKISAKPSKSPS